MTTFWAGPSCTHMLALLGADVIHVESTRRPDGTRLIAGVPISEENWWEKSPIFSGLNTNKKGVTLDLQSARGREILHRLIATCDVVVENFTPRVMDQLGLDFAAVQALRPDIVMLRMPGFGLDGPWRDNPAFAYAIEAAAGLSWLTGYPDRPPYEPYSVGDPNAGVHALNGLLLALEHRRRTGEPVLVEASMVDAAINIAAEQVIEYTAYGALLQRAGNRGPTAAPQNLYQTADIDEFGRADCWVAIAVATDDHWVRLREAIGNPAWAMSPDLATDSRAARTSRPRRQALVRLVRKAVRRRDRHPPLGCGCAGGESDAAAPADGVTATGVPEVLRGGGAPGQRRRAAQHAADAVFERTAPISSAACPSARGAQP